MGHNQVSCHLGKEWPENTHNFIVVLSVVASNRSKAQAKYLKKLRWKHASSAMKELFQVEFAFRKMPFNR